MIIKKVRGKNFLSIGNAFLEFDITKYDRSLIFGKNGNGKSQIANMIVFTLFDKMIKNITKSQIINSINGKGTLCEIEITCNGKEYLIRRGIKPNIFEIYEDSVALDQTVVKDFQGFLEKNILRTTYKTFLQTSILSIENYKPFMSLSKGDRRTFVEDILDIKVFSFMNQIVKSKFSKNKEELKLIDIDIVNVINTAKLQKSHIDRLQSLHELGIDSIKKKISDLDTRKVRLKESISTLENTNQELQNNQTRLLKLSVEHQKICREIDRLTNLVFVLTTELKEIHSTDNCSQCNQPYPVAHKNESIDSKLALIDKYTKNSSKLTLHIEKYSEISELDKVTQDINLNLKSLIELKSELRLIDSSIAPLNRELSEFGNTDELVILNTELQKNVSIAVELKNKKSAINTDQEYNQSMLELFSDSGVKAKIVDQYIPIINNLVNSYLEKLDFFISFNLDSEFNEIIKSRHRDAFSYASFSAGEKQRIDLALLFTFRQLAKIRNSFDCNLLFLDEICDSSIDTNGIDNLIKIFESPDLKRSNIVIISHRNKEVFEDRFSGAYEIYKEQGFSQILDMSTKGE